MSEPKLTVDDILLAQKRQAAYLDPNKTCATCRYKATPEDAKPCSKCVNSFIGIPFDPTEWEARP